MRAGLFASVLDSDIYRSSAYKRFGVTPSYEFEDEKLNVLYIDREPNRRRIVTNLDELRYYFKLNKVFFFFSF